MRLSALQASWRRDRWVARRRIALRWMAWYGWRYGLPALGLVTALVIVWRVVLAWNAAPAIDSTATPAAATPSVTRPDPPQDAPQLKLRFDPAWPAKESAAPRTISPALPAASNPDVAPPLTPHLKPENWLHSKEP